MTLYLLVRACYLALKQGTKPLPGGLSQENVCYPFEAKEQR